ncbi:hypothetical protein DFP90_10898 [Aestuariispira insulae]|uniref:Modulator of FtsH protease n=2 Tax=Aestuariispira insulae TaxID=1461337 RepID=A0A3D9HF20_9PROT|nr:hypothetical protein DFP90_10898 [Aestuariispira insulae]
MNRHQSTVMDRSGARADIDAGLRSYMLKVYNYMALGVAFTGLIVLFMSTNQELMYTLAVGPAKWVLLIALLGMGWFSPKIISMRSSAMAQGYYWLYCALWGVMISPMVAFYLGKDPMLVGRAFFITAGMFAGMSLIGYTTKKDLSGFGRFAMMACIGLILASLANVFFFQDVGMSLVISCGMVLLFAGITAWETQEIKNNYFMAGSSEAAGRFAIFGALQLYGSFVVMFVHLLNILGIMNGDD